MLPMLGGPLDAAPGGHAMEQLEQSLRAIDLALDDKALDRLEVTG